MSPVPRPTRAAAPGATRATRRRRAPGRPTAAVLALLASLALAGCSLLPGAAPSDTAQDSPAASAALPVPAGLEAFYDQTPQWKDCEGGQCAQIEAPLDYAHPDGERISLALFRKPATGQRQGSLVMNPGGPGGSGVDYVRDSADYVVSQDVRSAYDLVGFDPRGVGHSTAVRCLSDAQQDRERERARLVTDTAGIKTMLRESKAFSKECDAHTEKGLLQHVDSDSAAQDLDLIRAALGEDTLDYLGFSYGTKLGALYLGRFPQRAGRIVLDGALDPSLDSTQVATGQAVAFERALDLYLQHCLDGQDCPFTGDVEHARAQLSDLLTAADEAPLPSDSGRTVPAPDIVSALLLPLYEPSLAPSLTQALASAMQDGDGTALLALADLSAERDPDGSYANNTEAAFTAINCVDYPHESGSVTAVAQRAEALQEQAPFFGKLMGYDDGCSTWPAAQVVTPAKVTVPDTLAPVVVVGTTGDPATPYAWAQSLTGQLTNSRLLTYQGEGHTAYGRSDTCITQAVDGYLLRGTLPAEGTKC